MKRNYIIGTLVIIAIALIVGVALKQQSKETQTTGPTQKPSQEQPKEQKTTVPVTPPKTTTSKTPPPSATITKSTGRVVFAVTDTAVSFDGIQSVLLDVEEVEVQHPTKGWIAVIQSPRQYDLLKLRRNPLLAFVSDINLESGNYNQLRMKITKISVVKPDGTHETKLPSKELKLVTKLVVVKDEISAVIFDFELDKSLHITGDGKYIFMPVIQLETRSHLSFAQIRSSEISIPAGKGDFHASIGMDLAGNLKVGFAYNPWDKFEIENDAIKLIPSQQLKTDY